MAYSPSRRSRYDESLSPPRSVSRSRSPVRYRHDNENSRNPGNNLYVTGLSSRVRERDIEEYFGREGKVIDCHLVTDPRTRESRGFAFVTMGSVESADRCIKYLDNSVFEGRVITVEKARRKRARTPTPGRYLGIKTTLRSSYCDRRNSYSEEDSPRASPRYSPFRKHDYPPPCSSSRDRGVSTPSDVSESSHRGRRSHYRSRSHSKSPSYSPHAKRDRSDYRSRSRSPRYRSSYRSRSRSSLRSRSPLRRYRSAYRSRSRSPLYRRRYNRSPSHDSNFAQSQSPSPYRPSRASYQRPKSPHRSHHRSSRSTSFCRSRSHHSAPIKKAHSPRCSPMHSPRGSSRSYTPYSDRGSDSPASYSR